MRKLFDLVELVTEARGEENDDKQQGKSGKIN